MHLDGHVMVPNLGYKKDTFLEPSLVSNFLSNTPITTFQPQPLCQSLAVTTSKPATLMVTLRHLLHRSVLPLGQTALSEEDKGTATSTSHLKENLFQATPKSKDACRRHSLSHPWRGEQGVCPLVKADNLFVVDSREIVAQQGPSGLYVAKFGSDE